MAILDTIRELVFGKGEEKATKIIPDNAIDNFDSNMIGDLLSPIFRDIPPESKVGKYLTEGLKSWSFIAISAIADEMATNDYAVYQRTRTNDWVEVEENSFIDLFEKPNPVQTKEEFLWLLSIFYLGAGEVPILLNDAKNPTSMIILNPDRLTVKYDKEKMIGGYSYMQSDGKKNDIEADKMILFKLPNVNNPFRGTSYLKYIAKTIDIDNCLEEYLNMFFFNSALPTGVLQTDMELNKNILNRLRSQFQATYKGVKNAHKLAILEKGLTFNTTSFKISELQAIELQNLIRDKIFAAFKVPKSIVGIVEDVNRANAESSDYTFSKRAVYPKLKMLQGQINQFLLPKFSDEKNLYFEFDNPVKDDAKLDADINQIYLNTGVLTTNEVRESLGLDPLDEVGTPIVPEKILHKNARKINRFKGLAKRAKVGKKSEKEMTKAMSSILKTLVGNGEGSKEVKKKKFTNEEKEKYHNAKIVFSDRLEAEYKAKLSKYFKKISRVVLSQVKGYEIGDDEEEILMKMSIPYYEKAIEMQGDLTWSLLGSTATLDVQDRLIQKYIKDTAKDMSASVVRTTNDDIAKVVSDWNTAGEALPDLRGRLRDYFEGAELNRAETIARTEISRANGYATMEVFRQAKVVGKEWFTAEDEKVCPDCEAMDGKVIPVDEAFFKDGEFGDFGDIDSYPLHPSCRCDLLPVFDESLVE